MTPDPIARFRRWYAAAARAPIALPDAMALATADRRGRPSVRFVLLKRAGPDGFVFFTDGDSRKGRELRGNPWAALVFYWDPIGRQVRVEGRVEPIADGEADAYWATRPRGSRLEGAVSSQSAPLASRALLLRRWRRLRARSGAKAVPRPPEWTGYRIVPRTIEFWSRGKDRLHHREEFRRGRRGWRRRLLQP